MNIAQSLIPELDQETKTTRTALERIPDGKLDWRPHDKSWTFRELGTHLTNIPGWGVYTLQEKSLNLAGPDAPASPEPADSTRALLDTFDRKVVAFRAALADASDQSLMAAWTLSMGDHEIFTMPRVAVLRSMIFNHTIHHRAQLGVYLRLNDLPVPRTYGPSADEQ